MSNWFKSAQSSEPQPWQSTEEQWAGKLNAGDDSNFDSWSRKSREWRKSMQEALSSGLISPQEAKRRGRVWDSERLHPLPQLLYHVTTAKDKVLSEGLKTREQIKGPVGLGGGPDDTVSLTEDLQTARAIKSAILESISFMSGRTSVEQLIDMAKKGEGASRPWYHRIVENRSQAWVDALVSGEDVRRFKEPVNQGLAEFVLHREGQFVPSDMDASGEARTWVRRIPAEELEDMRVSLLKAWMIFREEAGGPMDPLFWGDSLKSSRSINPDQVAIIAVRPVQGALGLKESALGEWRVWTGKAVQVEGAVD